MTHQGGSLRDHVAEHGRSARDGDIYFPLIAGKPSWRLVPVWVGLFSRSRNYNI